LTKLFKTLNEQNIIRGGWSLNTEHCIYYALSLSTEISSGEDSQNQIV